MRLREGEVSSSIKYIKSGGGSLLATDIMQMGIEK